MRLALLWLLCSCGVVNDATGGIGLDLPWLDLVYECQVEDAANGHAIVNLELCFDDSADELERQLWNRYGGFAICGPTQRHLGPCLHDCPPPESNCNASGGCFCP